MTAYQKYFLYLALSLTPIFFLSCSSSGTRSSPSEEAAAAPDEDTAINKSAYPDKFDNYLVRLTAVKKIQTAGSPGKAIVWIGDPSYRQDMPSPDDVYAEKNISGIGQWVKLGLNAPDFQDVNESECMLIPPTGTEEVFWLYPKQTKNGTYKISAYVKLFTSKECRDSFNQKFSDIVEVEVEIAYENIVITMLADLWDVFWEKALWFWGALLALIFTLILRKVKQRLGDKEN
ncbi:MAG: hypothetical protein JU82_00715 [Sulfuricurvum sp. MLSB]|uniref:hypothetical protein n=1 Tax=unclassified Sulfuricurvum TaxID=2632390 RepID=UPI0005063356|nr:MULTISPECIES: hypothetical protein [unclassified Sulfuricurvum]KFN40838.1 MAG: hypothetical protein JU82_00715 [Sulfuricurvum sp. MLSB]